MGRRRLGRDRELGEASERMRTRGVVAGFARASPDRVSPDPRSDRTSRDATRCVGQTARGRDPVADGARVGPAHGRDGGGLSARAGPLQDRQAGVGVRRPGAPATSVGRDGPARPNHQTRPGAAAQDAGGMRLVHGALQRLGAKSVPAAHRRRPASQEAGDRRFGAQDPGAIVGDAARQETVERSADASEIAACAVEAAPPGGDPATSASEAANNAGQHAVTYRRH